MPFIFLLFVYYAALKKKPDFRRTSSFSSYLKLNLLNNSYFAGLIIPENSFAVF